MNNLEHLTGHAMRKEPPAAIDDTQRPTWNAVIAEYRNIGEEIIKDDIIHLMESRAKMGFEKHGTHLTPNNGRNSLRDALQEQLDCVVYLKNAELEETNKYKKQIITDAFHFSLLTLENIYIVMTLQEE